jgi:hypothetical protein
VCLTKLDPNQRNSQGNLSPKGLGTAVGRWRSKNEFWWGVGERGTAQSIQTLFHSTAATSFYFPRSKIRAPEQGLGNWRACMAEIPHARRRHTPRHTETRVDHLCCRDQRAAHSDEAFRPCLQLSVPLKIGGRAFRFSTVITKSQQRRKTWKVCKRQTNYRSIGQVDELSDFGSGVR